MSKKEKDYSASEVAQLVQQAVSAVVSGNLSGTVFGAPEDASAYDALSANAQGMMSHFVNRYGPNMLMARKAMRLRSVAAATGTGVVGVNILDRLGQFSPGLANNILGFHGMDEALESMIRNANGLASATGRAPGGIMSPGQMSRNMMFAASQGALAINNNFNDKGHIDARFTSGLNLPQAAAVANNILADSSQYDSWARAQLQKTRAWTGANPNADAKAREKAGVLTEEEITAFRRGTAMTDASVRSFNDHIKTFQKEMNGFVASVSKITGSFESAVDFLQEMTNGKAFSAGEEAANARRRASQVAANLRVLAADSGVDPRMLHGMIKSFGGKVDAGLGKDVYEHYFGNRSVAAGVGALGAAALTSFMKAHPGASLEDRRKMELGLAARSEGYGQGDAIRQNPLLAEAVRIGKISLNDAMALARSGDQEKVTKFLRQTFGAAMDTMANSEHWREIFTNRNQDVVNQLNTVSFNEGTANEGVLKSQRQSLSDAKMLVTSMLRTTLKDKNISRDVENMHKEALLDDAALRAAGLTGEQVEAIKKLAKERNLGVGGIKAKLRDMGADEFAMNRVVFKSLSSKLHEKYDNKGVDEALAQFDSLRDMVTPEVTSEDIKRRRVRKASEGLDKQLQKRRADYAKAMSDNDEDKAYEILKDMRSMVEEAALGGGGDFELKTGGADSYTGFMIQQSMNTLGGLKSISNDKKREQAAGVAKAEYEKARREGKTSEQAWEEVGKKLEQQFGVNGAGFTNTMNRLTKTSVQDFITSRAVSAGVNRILGFNSNILDEGTRANIYGRVMESLRDGSVRKDMEKQVKEDSPKLKGLALEKEINRRIISKQLTEAIGKELGNTKNEKLQGKAAKKARRMLEGLGRNMHRWVDGGEMDKLLEGQYKELFDSLAVNEDKLNQNINGEGATEEEQLETARETSSWSQKLFSSLSGKGRAVASTNKAVQSGTAALDNENTEAVVTRADQLDAEARNKPFGIPGDFDIEQARILTNFDKKLDYLNRMFAYGTEESKEADANSFEGIVGRQTAGVDEFRKTFTRQWGGKEEDAITEKHIANLFTKILSETEGMETGAARKYIQDKYGGIITTLGLRNALFEAKDSSGNKIRDARLIMGAYSAGSAYRQSNSPEAWGLADKKGTEDAMALGYTGTAAVNGDRRLDGSSAVNHLRILSEFVKDIGPELKKVVSKSSKDS